MIKPRSFFILTTGMFNLIVKDPYAVDPPERLLLDRDNSHSAAVLELAALCFARFPRVSSFRRSVKQFLFARPELALYRVPPRLRRFLSLAN
jgi:hypothetical protein